MKRRVLVAILTAALLREAWSMINPIWTALTIGALFFAVMCLDDDFVGIGK